MNKSKRGMAGHRGYGKFYVGYEIKEGSIMIVVTEVSVQSKTLEQARQLAIDIAEF